MPISFTLIWQSFIISLVAICGITLAADLIQRNWKKLPSDCDGFFLRRIISDEKGRCSLSFFQFLLWTIVISFFFLMIYVIRLLSGTFSFPTNIPADLLALMGISVVVPFLSKGISDSKARRGAPKRSKDESVGCAAMLEENGQPSLNRYQMFLWTWLGVGIYIFWFFGKLMGPEMTVGALELPDIDPMLVYLMGLSQTGFLAGKIVSGKSEPDKVPSYAKGKDTKEDKPTVPKILDIQPREMTGNQHILITGENFGQTIDSIYIGPTKLQSGSIKLWENKRIELNIPEEIQPGTYDLYISISSGQSNKEKITIRQETTFKKGGLIIHLAEIEGDLWSDSPGATGAWDQPSGFRDIRKGFNIFYKFKVPEGTDPYGKELFKTSIWIDGKYVKEREDLPNPVPEGNVGAYTYKFFEEGTHRIEVRGINVVSRNILIKKGVD